MKKLIIIQTVSPSYRNKLYHDLSLRLKDDFHLYSGDTYFEDSRLLEEGIYVIGFFFPRCDSFNS